MAQRIVLRLLELFFFYNLENVVNFFVHTSSIQTLQLLTKYRLGLRWGPGRAGTQDPRGFGTHKERWNR